MSWEWVAPSVTGLVAITTIGVTTQLEAVRRRREDHLRAQADGEKDRDQQRALAVEAARMLDIVDAVVREFWDGKDSRAAAIPGFKLAWPVADLLRVTEQLKEKTLRQRARDTADLIRLHRYAELGGVPPGAVVLGATEEMRWALSYWHRGKALPEVSSVFERLLEFVRERAKSDIDSVAASSGPVVEDQPASDLSSCEPVALSAWLKPLQSQW
jgi:hypothetical protein